VSITHACPASKRQTEHDPDGNCAARIIIADDSRRAYQDLHMIPEHSLIPKTETNGVKHASPDEKRGRLGRQTIYATMSIEDWLTAKLSLPGEQIATTSDTTSPSSTLHREPCTVPNRISHLPRTAKDTRKKSSTRRTQRLHGVLDGAINRDMAHDRLRKGLEEDGHHYLWRNIIPPGPDDDKPTNMIS
jgi:aspartyl aminopeptidase